MRIATTFKLHGPEVPKNLDEPAWLSNSVADLTGVSLAVLKAWLSRDPLVIPLGPYDQEARGKGSARVFTLRRVLAVAITVELVRLGIAPSRAGGLATAFMDDFIAGEHRGSDQKHSPKTKSAHWRHRDAVLVAFPDKDDLWVANGRKDSLETVAAARDGSHAAAVVVFYGAIVDRVADRLGKVTRANQISGGKSKRVRSGQAPIGRKS